MVTSSAPSNTWQELPIGPGGMITGIDIAPDNTLVVRTGIHSAKIALLGNYIASNFAMASDNHGGTAVVVEATGSANQSLLTHPHP